MATTTDTLIFELKVKDDAGKVFDSWAQRIRDLEKQFDSSFKNMGQSADHIKDPINAAKKATNALFPTFQKVAGGFNKFANTVIDGFANFKDTFKNIGTSILSLNIPFAQIAKIAVKSFAIIGKAIATAFKGFATLILAPFKLAIDIIEKFGKVAKKAFLQTLKFAKKFAIDATKNFLKYEKSLLVIARTTGEAWDKTKQFGDTLLDMSLSVGDFAEGGALEDMGLQAGIAADGLAEIAGIAGQLGMNLDDGGAAMLSFVNTVAKMSAVTNFATNAAATFLSTMGNIFRLDSTGIERLASTVNALGNQTVATQTQIGELTRRMAGTAEFFGLTADQVAAFSATLREAGVTVRVGGTAMSRLMVKLLADGAKMAASLGLNWENLKRTLESNNPVPALQEVLVKIREISQSGGRITVAEKLRDIGITGIGLQDTLLKLSQNTGLLTKNLNIAAREWSKNDSITKEYATTLQTAGHQFAALGNFIDGIKKVVGQDLAVAFGNFTENYLTPLVAKMLEWVKSKEVQTFLEETLPAALDWIGEKIGIVAEFFGNFFEQAKNIGVWEAFKNAIGTIFNGVKNLIRDVWNTMTMDVNGTIANVKLAFKRAWDEIKTTAKAAFEEVKDSIFDALSNVSVLVGDIFGANVQKKFDEFVKFLGEVPGIIAEIHAKIQELTPSFEQILEAAISLSKAILDIKNGIADTFGGGVVDTIKNMRQGLADLTASANAAIWKEMKNAIGLTSESAKDAAKSIQTINTAQKEVLSEGVTDSVWPEMQAALLKTAQMADSVAQSIRQVNAAQKQVLAEGETQSVWPEMRQALFKTAQMADSITQSLRQTNAAQQQVLADGVTNSVWPEMQDAIEKGHVSVKKFNEGLAGTISETQKMDTAIARTTQHMAGFKQGVQSSIATVQQMGAAAANMSQRLGGFTQDVQDNISTAQQGLQGSQQIDTTAVRTTQRMARMIAASAQQVDTTAARSTQQMSQMMATQAQPQQTVTREQPTLRQPQQVRTPTRPQIGRQAQVEIPREATTNIIFQGQNVLDESSKTRFARQISEQQQKIASNVIQV